jgi:hypothetical protein
MTTYTTIINTAFRESGITAAGDTPSTTEQTEAFALLSSIVQDVMGHEIGELQTDIDVGTSGLTNASAIAADYLSVIQSWYIPNNARLICNLASAVSLFLPPLPGDGSRLSVIDNAGNFSTNVLTLNGNGRKIDPGTGAVSTLALNTNGATSDLFYRADLGKWITVDLSSVSSSSPLPAAFDDYLATLLALRINPRYGAQTKPETAQFIKDMQRKLRSRYRQPTDKNSELALIRLPSTYSTIGLYPAYSPSNPNNFNQGIS